MAAHFFDSIKPSLKRWRSRILRSNAEHLQLGARGEKLAAQYLRRQGFKILYRNFRGRTGGEIDLVCRDRDTLVFVEVKTRTREDFGRPLEAVNTQKERRISMGALAWLRLLGNPDIFFRFDVVEVMIAAGEAPKIELVRNAFQLSSNYRY
jgi:putative endonuclease